MFARIMVIPDRAAEILFPRAAGGFILPLP